jgi:hypothetical protein
MPAKESRENIRSSIWKAIAQSEIDLGDTPSEEVEKLVDVATEAAILEIDGYMDRQTEGDRAAADSYYALGEGGDEKILWKGRPLLSISEHYVITNERVRIVKGLLGKDREDVELIRIQDIDQSQTLRERALNVGDIIIRSHDSSTPLAVLNNVHDVQAVHEILRRAVISARKQNRMTFQEEM